MRKTVNLKKGLNMRLEGGCSVQAQPVHMPLPGRVAIVPDDFPGLLPKLEVGEGDTVCPGSPLMHDKNDTDIKLVSPVGGTVEAVVRGARRKIERVVIKTHTETACEGAVNAAAGLGKNAPLELQLKRSGLWAMMRQRPYDTIPMPGDKPRDIFVTGLDTAPLAPDIELAVNDRLEWLEAGVKALKSLTQGNVYVSVAADSQLPDIAGAVMAGVPRLHPAGNAGTQIAALSPVNKGDVVWTLDIVTLARIGQLELEGSCGHEVTVALTGGELTEPHTVVTVPGAPLGELLRGCIREDGRNKRFISGNVLTGIPVGLDGYLRYPYRQVTVIPEGDDVDEFMGWASLNSSKMSESRSFLSRLLGRRHNPDARLLGGRRAMIMSGVYERYIPLDIMPEHLVKAILSRDIDRMEALGIYEVAPEDFALAEYADPSKLELQRIVREGLEYMRSEV